MSYACAAIQNVVDVVRANAGRNGGGATRLNELTDVNPALPTVAGSGLVYTGGIWDSQVVVSNGFNLGPTPEASVYRDITNNAGTNTANFRQLAPGSGVSLAYSPDDNYIVISGGVASAKFVDLLDVAPMVPVANQALHYNAVTSKWEQVEELKVDSTTRQIALETTGAIAIVGDGAVGIQSLVDSVTLAGAVDANLTAATGDINITAIGSDIRMTANNDVYIDAMSGGIIDASALNGMILKADAGSVAITSLQDEVVINGKTGVSVLSGIGGPIEITAGANAGVSLLAGVNATVSLTSGLDGDVIINAGTNGNVTVDTTGTGFMFLNSATSCTTQAQGGDTIFNVSDAISFQTLEVMRVDGETPASYAAKVVASLDGNVIPNRQYVEDVIVAPLLTKATIGGDVVTDASAYKLGTVSGDAPSTRIIHNDVACVNATTSTTLFGDSTVITEVNGISGDISIVNALNIGTQTGTLTVAGKDGLNLTSDIGPLVIECLNEAIDIACPNFMTLGIIDGSILMNDTETIVSRDGAQRITLTDTISAVVSPGGDVEIECEGVAGVVRITSGTADDYAAKIFSVPTGVPNVRYIDNAVAATSSYMSGGISDFQSAVPLNSNANAVYHNATTYNAVKNVTQIQFWVNIIGGSVRMAIYRGWDTTATLIAQTPLIAVPVIGLNTATFSVPFDLGANENIVIGFGVANNTLKVMGVDGLNLIRQAWLSNSVTVGGFLANPGPKNAATNTRIVSRLL